MKDKLNGCVSQELSDMVNPGEETELEVKLSKTADGVVYVDVAAPDSEDAKDTGSEAESAMPAMKPKGPKALRAAMMA